MAYRRNFISGNYYIAKYRLIYQVAFFVSDTFCVESWSITLTSPPVRTALSHILVYLHSVKWPFSTRVWTDLVVKLSKFSLDVARLALGLVIDATESEFVAVSHAYKIYKSYKFLITL